MKTRNLIAAAAAALVAGGAPALAGSALAQTAGPPADPAAAEIVRTLEAQGYTNVHDVELDDGVWEADATAPDGKQVDLTLDAAGKVVTQVDDD
jgi:hypothetical protein